MCDSEEKKSHKHSLCLRDVAHVHSAAVNFPVIQNYSNFLREFCVATLGTGAGSSRLEEIPEDLDAEEEGAVIEDILPFL